MNIWSNVLNAEIEVSYSSDHEGNYGELSIYFATEDGKWDKLIEMEFTPIFEGGEIPTSMNPDTGHINHIDCVDAVYIGELSCDKDTTYPQLIAMIEEELESTDIQQD